MTTLRRIYEWSESLDLRTYIALLVLFVAAVLVFDWVVLGNGFVDFNTAVFIVVILVLSPIARVLRQRPRVARPERRKGPGSPAV